MFDKPAGRCFSSFHFKHRNRKGSILFFSIFTSFNIIFGAVRIINFHSIDSYTNINYCLWIFDELAIFVLHSLNFRPSWLNHKLSRIPIIRSHKSWMDNFLDKTILCSRWKRFWRRYTCLCKNKVVKSRLDGAWTTWSCFCSDFLFTRYFSLLNKSWPRKISLLSKNWLEKLRFLPWKPFKLLFF